ncbi:hypothetical protein KM92DES2_11472 [uncultured Desulfovibrio sp.]|uniref:Uncharacterized protein n=1 Tax=uncultured Desulfovibrio sp. TaxID=167968 RepID=A0A212JPC7_9BACT|nr:hypothetical protein KM92DES2_11472 [uncultured Desulfovibrio sp.]
MSAFERSGKAGIGYVFRRAAGLRPSGAEVSPSGEVWDACPARGKGDRLWGCAPPF